VMFCALGIPPAGSMPDKPDPAIDGEMVILLHGMGRTRYSMRAQEKYLSKRGYQTINTGYPSTSKPVGNMVDDHVARMVETCMEKKAKKIHFVTHSLGGILVRQYLQDHTLPAGSRIVMISPPNKGSELADRLKDFFLYKWRNGPAGQVLGTGPDSLPNSLNPVDAQIGVITGNRSFNPVFSAVIDGEDDGKVSVSRAKLDEMKDFFVVDSSHAFIMSHEEVLKQTVCFLANGTFCRDPAGKKKDKARSAL